MKKMLAALGLVALFATAGMAQDVDITASWTPPTEGAPVEFYILQVSVDGGVFVTLSSTIVGTEYTFTGQYMSTYIGRVAGIDEYGRQGPYSEDSDPFVPDLGPPTAPGKPVLTESVGP